MDEQRQGWCECGDQWPHLSPFFEDTRTSLLARRRSAASRMASQAVSFFTTSIEEVACNEGTEEEG